MPEEDLDQIAHEHPSRAHIPPDIRAAIRRRAVEAAENAPDLDQNPVFRQWMRDIFIPAYRALLAERAAADDDTPGVGGAP